MRFFSPSIAESTSALLASSLERSRSYSPDILLIASASSSIFCVAFVCTMSPSAARTVVVRLMTFWSCCEPSNSTTTSPFFTGRPDSAQVDDAQTGDLRRFQDDRAGALDIAACAHADDEFATPHASHGNFHFRGSGVAVGRDGAAAAQGERDRPGDDLDSPRVRFTQPLAGSLILRWHFRFLWLNCRLHGTLKRHYVAFLNSGADGDHGETRQADLHLFLDPAFGALHEDVTSRSPPQRPPNAEPSWYCVPR